MCSGAIFDVMGTLYGMTWWCRVLDLISVSGGTTTMLMRYKKGKITAIRAVLWRSGQQTNLRRVAEMHVSIA